jgi:hypothetical protein
MYALPRQIFIANDTDVGDLASNVDEKPCMTNFRWVMFVVDVLYLVLMAVQRCVREKFPSERFDGSRSTMIVHICCGLIIIYMGCMLHLQNEANPITRIHDASSLQRHFLYYILALATITHSVTVVKVSSKVMGERRITLPLFIGAGLLNFINAVHLLIQPTLQNAFLVWGSVNTFIFVRVNLLLLAFSKIDWELSYTYAIISAALVTYPMTNQPYYTYYSGYIAPLLYAPFHERVSAYFGWETEDTLGGNKPAEKNIIAGTKDIREKFNLSIRVKAQDYGSVDTEVDEKNSSTAALDVFSTNIEDDSSLFPSDIIW